MLLNILKEKKKASCSKLPGTENTRTSRKPGVKSDCKKTVTRLNTQQVLSRYYIICIGLTRALSKKPDSKLIKNHTM